MGTRCKFKCESKNQNESGFQVIMKPVTCGSKENEDFFKFTPYGIFDFGTVNEKSAEQFEPGKEYFIDITLAK